MTTPSTEDRPATECPPERIARLSPARRANPIAAAASAGDSHLTIAAGLTPWNRAISGFRAASYPADPGTMTSPPIRRASASRWASEMFARGLSVTIHRPVAKSRDRSTRRRTIAAPRAPRPAAREDGPDCLAGRCGRGDEQVVADTFVDLARLGGSHASAAIGSLGLTGGCSYRIAMNADPHNAQSTESVRKPSLGGGPAMQHLVKN
jgi:hypothetical protein